MGVKAVMDAVRAHVRAKVGAVEKMAVGKLCTFGNNGGGCLTAWRRRRGRRRAGPLDSERKRKEKETGGMVTVRFKSDGSQ